MWWLSSVMACGSPVPLGLGESASKLESRAEVSGGRPETLREMTEDAAAIRTPADGGGRLVEVSCPARIAVGAPVEIGLTLEVGPEGIAVGGAIHVLPSPFWGWSPPQDQDPLAPGFTVLGPPDGVTFETRSGGGMLIATVGGRSLRPGERVGVVYGAGKSARADRFAERAPAMSIGVDGDGDGVRALIADEVRIETEPGPPAGWVVTVPSSAVPGAPSTLRVAVVDAVGNGFLPVDTAFGLTADPALGLPATARLVQGVLAVPFRPTRAGVYVVDVTGPDGLRARSNPLVVRDGAAPILWADLHVHTALSDGSGDPADVYRYAREVAGLDVAAITDHDHWGLRFLDDHPGLVERLQRATEDTNDPGAFVAVHGWEWTSWRWGHRQVLDFDGPGAIVSSLDPATDTPGGLWAALGDRRVITVPHHPAGGPIPIDWSVPSDPRHEPVVEIVSVHGQSGSPALPGPIYDAEADAWVEDRLVEGRRFGLIGATDSHDGHPGLSQLAGGGGGLAALEGAAPTRDGVYGALMSRRVYATNGPRIVLRYTAAGQPMGSTLRAEGPVTLEVRVVGTAPVTRVELQGRDGLIGSRAGGSALVHATWTVEPRPGDAFWIRVVQDDGGLAWSSPVFFD